MEQTTIDDKKTEMPLTLSFNLNYENKILKEELIEFFKTKCNSKYLQLSEELGENTKEHYQGLVETSLYTDKRTFLRKYWNATFTCKARSAMFKSVTQKEHKDAMFPYLCKGYKKERLDLYEPITPKVRIIHNDLNWTDSEIRKYNHAYHTSHQPRTQNMIEELGNNIDFTVTDSEINAVWLEPNNKYRDHGYDWNEDDLSVKIRRYINAKKIVLYLESKQKTWSLHQIERYVNFFMNEKDKMDYLKYKLIFNA